uniref:Uncharacterized protein n=1 Tax=Rhizophora mucronata TaxID=61149 RepID=A0A2P2LC19_RHIMU
MASFNWASALGITLLAVLLGVVVVACFVLPVEKQCFLSVCFNSNDEYLPRTVVTTLSWMHMFY